MTLRSHIVGDKYITANPAALGCLDLVPLATAHQNRTSRHRIRSSPSAWASRPTAGVLGSDPQRVGKDGRGAGESSYVDCAPALRSPRSHRLSGIQQVGDRPVAQRHVPHGGAEVRCVLGEAPRLLGPQTAATYQEIPAGGTVVGVRCVRACSVSRRDGRPTSWVDQDIAGSDIWRDLARLTDRLGEAATRGSRSIAPVVRRAIRGEPDPLVNEAVRNLMPWHGSERHALPALLSISDASCGPMPGSGRRRSQGVHRLLRFRASTPASWRPVTQQGASDVDLARWGRRDRVPRPGAPQPRGRRITGVPPGEFLAQSRAACTCGHDHAASIDPMLHPGDAVLLQAGRLTPA